MGWPSIPKNVLGNEHITIRRATWTQDENGGKVRNLGSISESVTCAIRGANAKELHANFRDGSLQGYIVAFTGTNPKLRVRDQLFWIEEKKTLTVTGYSTVGDSDGRIWLAYVEERPA